MESKLNSISPRSSEAPSPLAEERQPVKDDSPLPLRERGRG
jgi:hypothetical protein